VEVIWGEMSLTLCRASSEYRMQSRLFSDFLFLFSARWKKGAGCKHRQCASGATINVAT